MRSTTISVLALAAVLLAAPTDSIAGSARIGTGAGDGVPAISLADSRMETVVRQQYDYSCGSAALATLLRFHYRRPKSEAEVFRAMYEAGDQARIREAGFSLLDMKLYLQSLGLRADGYRISLDELARVAVPAISLIQSGGSRHFVVIKGIRGDHVLVGDPASGTRAFSRAAFERVRVDRIAFVIRDDAEIAKASFNRPVEWAEVDAPPDTGADRKPLPDRGLVARVPARDRPARPSS